MRKYIQQIEILTWKNILLKKRNGKQFFKEIFIPLVFILILAMMKMMLTLYPEQAIHTTHKYQINNISIQEDFSRSIMISPNTSRVQKIASNSVNILRDMMGLNHPPSLLFYRNEDEMYNSYMMDKNVTAGIVFNYQPDDNLAYAIRMSSSDIADTETIYKDNGQCRKGNGLDSTNCLANTYLHTGFCMLQVAIDTALIRDYMEDDMIPVPDIAVQMLPKVKYQPNTLTIQAVSAIFIVVGYSQVLAFICVNTVVEKEKKIKDAMKIMGMTESAFWLSWAAVYIFVFVIVTIVTTIVAVLVELFVQSNMFIFFMILLLFGISEIAGAFALTPFFNKAQEAGSITFLASVLVSLLYLTVSLSRTITNTGQIVSTISPVGRCFLSLLSPAAFALAIDQAVFLDITGGMNFNNITEGDLPLYALLLMMIFDSFLYIALGVFCRKVIRGKNNTCFSSLSFKRGLLCRDERKRSEKNSKTPEEEVLFGSIVEKLGTDNETEPAIRLRNITKSFDTKEGVINAVDDFSLDIYENQITCLLGHNGAGKSTLISMLCGLQNPNAGIATVYGYDVSDDIYQQMIRTMIGVCSQYDALYDDLTCAEHIKLYGWLKGGREQATPDKISQCLNDVGLERHCNMQAKNMSGGQRRQLSVAIALIGDPKILILDEPTAGMDPCSRRKIWKLLKDRKRGKTILFSTHFMDEADILADRKAIISRGRLKCCGSSLFLKNKFGIGYHLNMVIGTNCNVSSVTSTIKKCVPGAKFQRSHGKELVYTLPLSDTSTFSDLFGALESRVSCDTTEAEMLGIASYGISMTTLEEVFLKIEEDESTPTRSNSHDNILHAANKGEALKVISANSDSCLRFDSPDNHCADHTIKQDGLNFRQFWTICMIKLLRTKRSKKLVSFVYLFLPVLFVVTGILISKFATPSDSLNLAPLNLTHVIGYYGRLNDTSIPDIIPPILIRDSADTFLSEIWMTEIQTFYITQIYTNDTELRNITRNLVGMNLENFQTNGFSVESAACTILYNTTAVHALPAMINFFSNTILRSETLLNGLDEKLIHTVNLPWPREKPDVNDLHVASNIILATAFIIIAPSFAVDLVRDRQTGRRTQLRVAGVTSTVYWASNYVIDVLKQYIPVALTVVMVLELQVKTFWNTGAVLSLILTLTAYTAASTVFSYVLSFSFSKSEACESVLPPSLLAMGILPYLAIALLDMFLDPYLAGVLHCIMCLIDSPYTIFGSIYYISRIYRHSGGNVASEVYFQLDSLISVTYITSVVHVVVFFMVLKGLDAKYEGVYIKNKFPCYKRWKTKKDRLLDQHCEIQLEDDDIRQEREKVSLIGEHKTSQHPIVVVQNLRKEFPPTKPPVYKVCRNDKLSSSKYPAVAVDNMTFAVDSGEVFGLLGPNGAGKSTTINMMIANMRPTLGNVAIAGYDIQTSLSDVYQFIGYCSQHDALWDGITLKEHLIFYASIRGVIKPDIERVVEWYINTLGLHEHQNKYAEHLSGGTKRKLSYVISMLGQPKIVLLDEPSTGVDPASKRLLWNTIASNFIGKERGAILTTHSMEEADALCSRMGIMVNGKLECLGASQQLKNKFGRGYFLEVKLSESNDASTNDRLDTLDRYIFSLFPAASLLERFGTRTQYKIPRDECRALSFVFSSLEKGKFKHSIEEYSFSQSTLEQVFLEFAKKQHYKSSDTDNADLKITETENIL